ncbi:hypothetical protein ACQPYE_26380 [Actinosynnema sp. CA-299493]
MAVTAGRTRGLIRPPVPQHRSIVVVDMAGSGRWSDPMQLQARSALNEVVRTAFRSARIAWWRMAVEDRGDGMIVLVPPSVSKLHLLNPVLPRLARLIADRNRSARTAERIRLRVAVHAGEVHRDATGWAGTDINLACRLVDDQAVRGLLRDDPALDMALVVSDAIHGAVVRHSYQGVTPTEYSPFRVVAKEVNTRAWLHRAGSSPITPARTHRQGDVVVTARAPRRPSPAGH